MGEEDGWYLASEIKAFWLILFINDLWRNSKASVKPFLLWWDGNDGLVDDDGVQSVNGTDDANHNDTDIDQDDQIFYQTV